MSTVPVFWDMESHHIKVEDITSRKLEIDIYLRFHKDQLAVGKHGQGVILVLLFKSSLCVLQTQGYH